MVMMKQLSVEGVAIPFEKAFKLGTTNLGNMKLNSKDKKDQWCSHYKKSSYIKETWLKLHKGNRSNV